MFQNNFPPRSIHFIFPAFSLLALFLSVPHKCRGISKSFYIDSLQGNDKNAGMSKDKPFKSLEKVKDIKFQPGDKILFKKNCKFTGKIELNGLSGIEIGAYGKGELPVIDSKGHIAAFHIINCSSINVNNLEITSDDGNLIDRKAEKERFGVLVESKDGATKDITLKNLKVHNVFANKSKPHEGANKTSNMGIGIRCCITNKNGHMKNIIIEDCLVSMTGFLGINIRGNKYSKVEKVNILNNKTNKTGGTGLLFTQCKNVLVKGNETNFSGSDADPRMHARGSGSWTWTCENVLYENNRFMNAKGKGDSCGIHIDFNCSDIVVQRCLSYNNAGGFIEILGNNKNCAYRYNISINDGYRTKGKDGAKREGKIFWLSNFCGSKGKKQGPYNSYIYNNTIFVKEDIITKFSTPDTAKGVLIANNIFHILGPTKNVSGDQMWRKKKKKAPKQIKNLVFKNNIYTKKTTLPSDFLLQDTEKIIADPKYKNPGGTKPEDYIPTNFDIIKDKGIEIEKLPDDEIGLKVGLKMVKDFFGNPIKGKPDMGAIETP